MKHLLLSGLSILVLTSTSVWAQDDSSEALSKKLQLAAEYSKVVPVEDEVNMAIENLTMRVPKDDRVLFKSILERTMKVSRLKAASEMALAEIFTEQELKALVDFYATPEGEAVRKKMPQYQERLQPVLEQMVREALESYQAQKQ